jgi:hypothetical protein
MTRTRKRRCLPLRHKGKIKQLKNKNKNKIEISIKIKTNNNKIKMKFICPKCMDWFELDYEKCGVLRHGFYVNKKGKIKQLPKHSTEENHGKLIRKYKIFGCGAKLKIDKKTKCIRVFDEFDEGVFYFKLIKK